MSTATTTGFPVPSLEADPFFYGWRYVKCVDAHGNEDYVEVPLTEEDVLHPQEDDQTPQSAWHGLTRDEISCICRAYLSGRDGFTVVSKVGIKWDSEYGWHHAPDVTILSDNQKPWPLHESLVSLKQQGAKPNCVVEVTSPITRHIDFGKKKTHYFLVGVPCYVIVDLPHEGDAPARVLAYRPGKDSFESIPPDERGQVQLGTTGLWIGADGKKVFIEKAHGARLPGYLDWLEAGKASQLADQMKRKAEEAHVRRLELEARVQALEMELARMKSISQDNP